MADKKKPVAKGITKPPRIMAKKMIGSGVVQKILLKKALEGGPPGKSSDAIESSTSGQGVQIFEKEASEKVMSAKTVEGSQSQKPVVTKTCTSATQTVEEDENDASIDHLLALAKQKLMENDDAGLVCALCRNDFEKPQIVGAVLDKIRQLNNDPKKTNVYDIWLCRECFIDYSCKINTIFNDFFSNEWVFKGQPEQGPEIECVFQTVTSVIVLRVNDVKITFNDIEYLLFNGGKPLKDEMDVGEQNHGMDIDEKKGKVEGDFKQ